MLSPHEFYLKYIGKGIDFDGAAGVQCVDLWKLFLKELGYPNPAKPIGGSGYAKEIFLRRNELGYMDYFDVVNVNAMQDGDWAVWGNCTACPDTHVAMFRKDNGNGTGVFLGQNQGNVRYGTQINITYSGIIGVLRPKCYINKPSQSPAMGEVLNSIPNDFVYEKAKFTVTVDNIRIRKAPSLKGVDTGLSYDKGESVYYDGYVKRDGYVWISWISLTDHTRRWMACRVISTNEPWGTFS